MPVTAGVSEPALASSFTILQIFISNTYNAFFTCWHSDQNVPVYCIVNAVKSVSTIQQMMK